MHDFVVNADTSIRQCRPSTPVAGGGKWQLHRPCLLGCAALSWQLRELGRLLHALQEVLPVMVRVGIFVGMF